MRRLLALLALAPMLVPFAAAAAPDWKKAPNAPEEKEGGMSFSFEPDFEGDYAEYLNTAVEFLVNYYGYFGVAAVLLALYLFGRGRGTARPAAAPETGEADDEDYFEPEDYRRYDPRR